MLSVSLTQKVSLFQGGLELYHPAVREAAAEAGDGAETAAVGADEGRLWPVPQQMIMDEGDAVLVVREPSPFLCCIGWPSH